MRKIEPFAFPLVLLEGRKFLERLLEYTSRPYVVHDLSTPSLRTTLP